MFYFDPTGDLQIRIKELRLLFISLPPPHFPPLTPTSTYCPH